MRIRCEIVDIDMKILIITIGTYMDIKMGKHMCIWSNYDTGNLFAKVLMNKLEKHMRKYDNKN